MRGTRAILVAALLTALPVAAHAQGTHAPGDAFLYIIWPPGRRGGPGSVLVPVWPSRDGRDPGGAAPPQTAAIIISWST